MREHQDCLDGIDRAMAREKWGWAAYLEERCRRNHGHLPTFEPDHGREPQPTTTKETPA